MIPSGSMATLLAADSYMLWDVPDNWTLEEAATVPVVYGTVYHALLTVSFTYICYILWFFNLSGK